MERRRAGSGALGGNRWRHHPGGTGSYAGLAAWKMELGDRGLSPIHAADYEAILARTLLRLDERMRVAALERTEAIRLYDRLIARPPAQRRLLIRNLPLDHAFCLAALLIDESNRSAWEDPGGALEHAELATRVTARLSAAHYGGSLVAEVSARAWACLGNACRLAGRLESSDEAFWQARRYLEQGSGEPLEEALVYEREAALHATRGHRIKADTLLEAAAVRYREVRDRHLEGRVRVKQGVLELLRGRRQPALDRLTEGLGWLHGDREPYAAAAGKALLAALLAGEPSLAEQARARKALRQSRQWLDWPQAHPVRSLVKRVETLVLEGLRATGPGIPPEIARLVPAWPSRL